jgi:hypothetical protein
MLFKILQLFGIDLPARMAEVRVDVEERFDLAKDSVEQAAQTAAVLALLFLRRPPLRELSRRSRSQPQRRSYQVATFRATT